MKTMNEYKKNGLNDREITMVAYLFRCANMEQKKMLLRELDQVYWYSVEV